MRSLKILVLGIVCGLAPLGCSVTPDCGDDYRDSVITPTLEIPPDLIGRQSDKNLTLPGSKVGTEENTGRFVETGDLNAENKL